MEAPATGRLWALVLAGGDGTRLQALTRVIAGAPIPKQYCMVGRVARMLELVREVRPGDVAGLEGTSAEPDALAAAYDRLAAWNFSRDFLARVPRHLMVARANDLGWSDRGTPEAIERTLAALHVVPPWRAPLSATA